MKGKANEVRAGSARDGGKEKTGPYFLYCPPDLGPPKGQSTRTPKSNKEEGPGHDYPTYIAHTPHANIIHGTLLVAPKMFSPEPKSIHSGSVKPPRSSVRGECQKSYSANR